MSVTSAFMIPHGVNSTADFAVALVFVAEKNFERTVANRASG